MDSYYLNDTKNNSNVKGLGWINFKYLLKSYVKEYHSGTIEPRNVDLDFDTLKINSTSEFYTELLNRKDILNDNDKNIFGPFTGLNSEYIFLYESIYFKLFTEDSHFVKFINKFKLLNQWNDLVNIKHIDDFKPKWLSIKKNNLNEILYLKITPPYSSKNQKQLIVNEIDSNDYIKNLIYFDDNNNKLFLKNTLENNFYLYPNIIPKKDINIHFYFTKLSDKDNSELYLPNIDFKNFDSFSNNKYIYKIKNNSINELNKSENTNVILNNNSISNGRGSFLRLNWNTKSEDLLYNNISGYIECAIVSIRFKLNFSGASIMVNLDDNNNLIKERPLNNNTLGGNYNSILMNIDSDYEYLIVESLPFNNVFNDTVDIEIISSNESVFKSNIFKNIILSNTSELLRLQRMGDPRDYTNINSLIKLTCINHGITTLNFKVTSKNSLLNNIYIKPIKLIGVTIKIKKINPFINIAKGNGYIKYEMLPKNICARLFDKENEIWNFDNKQKKEVKEYNNFKNLSNKYLNDILMMNPDNDISLNNISYQGSYNNMEVDLHFKKRKTFFEENGDIKDMNNIIINNNTGDITIEPLSEGKLELLFLVNSKQVLSEYLKKTLTFNNNFIEFLDLKNNNNPLYKV